jgi:hypothetical protein
MVFCIPYIYRVSPHIGYKRRCAHKVIQRGIASRHRTPRSRSCNGKKTGTPFSFYNSDSEVDDLRILFVQRSAVPRKNRELEIGGGLGGEADRCDVEAVPI